LGQRAFAGNAENQEQKKIRNGRAHHAIHGPPLALATLDQPIRSGIGELVEFDGRAFIANSSSAKRRAAGALDCGGTPPLDIRPHAKPVPLGGDTSPPVTS